jgi:hypothetical protein
MQRGNKMQHATDSVGATCNGAAWAQRATDNVGATCNRQRACNVQRCRVGDASDRRAAVVGYVAHAAVAERPPLRKRGGFPLLRVCVCLHACVRA